MKHTIRTFQRFIRAASLITAVVILGTATAHAQEGTTEVPDVILIEQPALYPEGIEYDAVNDRFLVGSLSQGGIGEVTGSGAPTALISDTDVPSSVGIQIDAERNRLLVVSSDTRLFLDPTLPSHAALAAYDLETSERLFLTDLAAATEYRPNVANDVAVDAEGNAYVTDTFAPVIYRVDVDGNASIFWEDERFSGMGGPGLNGIEYHPDGYLLVPMMITQGMYKIPVDDPAALTAVTIDQPIIGADGVILHPDGRLIIVAGQTGTVYALRSNDEWETASVDGVFAVQPGTVASTATIRDGEVYVLYAHLEVMMAGLTPPDVFEIVRAEFVSP